MGMFEDWTKVEDQLPDRHRTVFAWAPDGKDQAKELMLVVRFDGRYFNYGSYYVNQLKGVTHWMYMPLPLEDYVDVYEEGMNNDQS